MPTPRIRRAHPLDLPALLAITAAVRLGWVLLFPARPVIDFAMYWESAQHLLAFGALDDGFAYMPGYVLLLAAVQALGGGVLAARLVGVAIATAGVAAVFGIARPTLGRRAALAAGGLYAVWPGGITFAGLLGTDLPATVAILVAVHALVAAAPRRPWLAAVGFGAIMGCAAWLRAVALPLSALSALYFLGRGARTTQALLRGGAALAVAALVLTPWGLRNHAHHGVFTLTDGHGGLTAALGAYPNTDGVFSHDVYRIIEAITGRPVLTGDHHATDREAYRIAKSLAGHAPLYTAGLALARGERLFHREQALLYWPVYRAGVLGEDHRAWFVRHRILVHGLADTFWWLVVGGFAVGAAVLFVRRRFAPLAAALPFQAALTAIYVLFFGEARYRLPIEALAFPVAGFGLVFFATHVRRALRGETIAVPRREIALAAGALLAVTVGARALVALGASLRDRHRFAVTLFDRAEGAGLAMWSPTSPTLLAGAPDALTASASGEARMTVEVGGHPPGAYAISLRAAGAALASVAAAEKEAAPFARAEGEGPPLTLAGIHQHGGGPLRFTVIARASAGQRVRLDQLTVRPAR